MPVPGLDDEQRGEQHGHRLQQHRDGQERPSHHPPSAQHAEDRKECERDQDRVDLPPDGAVVDERRIERIEGAGDERAAAIEQAQRDQIGRECRQEVEGDRGRFHDEAHVVSAEGAAEEFEQQHASGQIIGMRGRVGLRERRGGQEVHPHAERRDVGLVAGQSDVVQPEQQPDREDDD